MKKGKGKEKYFKDFRFQLLRFSKNIFFSFLPSSLLLLKYFELVESIRILQNGNENRTKRIFQIEEIPFHLNYFYNTRVDVMYSAINSRE
jgi:hypothetical protein